MNGNVIYVLSGEITSIDNEIKILPIGHVKSLKGNFIVDSESVNLMREAFKAHGIDIVVDYEHQTLNDVQAPAGGWIKDFYVKGDAVVAKIEWTPKAREYIENKEYRYLSPVVIARQSDKKVILLHSVALTNTPAIDNMYPIINSNKILERMTEMELLAQLRQILGLDENATQDDVIEKLTEVVAKINADNDGSKTIANKALLSVLDLKENATEQEIINKVMALKNPAGFVSAADFNALKQKIEEKNADALVLSALKQGKITAAQKPWALEYALKSPDGFNEYLKNAPAAVLLDELDIKANKQIPAALTETDIKICKMLGLSQEDIAKYGKDE